MSVEIESGGVVARGASTTGRHAAAALTLVPDLAAPPAAPPRHVAPATDGGHELVRELEAAVDRLHDEGPTPGARADLDGLLGAWADALMRVHRSRLTALTPVAPLPWVLVEPLPGWLEYLPADAGPAWAVRAHPGVRRAVELTRSTWSAAQWVHGDPTGDEVVVVETSHGPRAELSAAAGRGDPRWDVAAALDWLAVALGPALDPAWRIDPGARFLAAYRDLGGDATPSRAMAVARTLLTAVEWSAQLAVAQEPDDDERAWLAGLWTRPLELIGAVRPLSSARSR
ncbi:phosphotransferase family protein [Cellulomonas alba]|uniref:Aminoglycoside phosphotransferase domain-containing protein n=1 Tax=Cellulomonas alba TaxID=3053467 RepID=A0ABT7SDT7_9CELL|nr:hypothetical protein [Cellulomonas alba]MDM7854351.1 hypothetical protein [Cellulomonas alba]